MKSKLFDILTSISPLFYYLIEIFPGLLFSKILFQFNVIGKEKIKDIRGNAIIIVNHCNYFDCLLTAQSLFPFYIKFAGMLQHFKHPVLKILLPLLGAFPIKIDGTEDLFSFEIVRETLKNNGFIGIFPECHLKLNSTKTGKFRLGAFLFAHYFNSTIIPVVITINPIYIFNKKIPLFKKAIIEILEPRKIVYNEETGLDGNEKSIYEIKKKANKEYMKFLENYTEEIRQEINHVLEKNNTNYYFRPKYFINNIFKKFIGALNNTNNHKKLIM